VRENDVADGSRDSLPDAAAASPVLSQDHRHFCDDPSHFIE
jgi:hypothetical protein